MTKEQKFKQDLLDSLYAPWHLKQIPFDTHDATKLVFGKGNPAAKLMVVGEAPGQEEDRQGIPFVGRSGQLLTKTIASHGLSRDAIFITNAVKFRPPNNKTPNPQELAYFNKLLESEIKIVQPQVILAVGTVALSALLHNAPPISKARGNIYHKYNTLIIPTYHPAYILRNPAAFKAFSDDIMLAISKLK